MDRSAIGLGIDLLRVILFLVGELYSLPWSPWQLGSVCGGRICICFPVYAIYQREREREKDEADFTCKLEVEGSERRGIRRNKELFESLSHTRTQKKWWPYGVWSMSYTTPHQNAKAATYLVAMGWHL